MTAPLYYVPRGKTIDATTAGRQWSREFLDNTGLDQIFRDVKTLDRSTSIDLIGSGPDGGGGMIATAWAHEPPTRLGYYPDHQNWTECCRHGTSIWIGIDKLDPPTPTDLARTRHITGHKVRLDDGNRWLIPVYRSPLPDREGGLPRTLFRDSITGGVIRRVKSAYRDAWEQSRDVARQQYEQSSDVEYSWEWILDYCVQALSFNYRIDDRLQSVLELIDAENCWDIMRATVDWPKVLEAIDQKKTEATEPVNSGNTPRGSVE